MDSEEKLNELEEQWRPVLGWESGYSVSSHGRVRSEARIVERANGWKYTVSGRMLNPRIDDRGYPQVALYRNGRGSFRRVHTLVLEAFVGPRPDRADGCHNNGVKTDNRIGNLRWDSRVSNSLDTVEHGQNHNSVKTHCIRGHEFTPANTYRSASKPAHHRECLACIRLRGAQRRRAA
ncbi:HNH endonuclease [Nocardia cyriacigeorgica]|uniref:NUMOD4 domain-containing protein n=1 Tax=Nocardia cyriacigeorgica TaxID=135487 RepID=UPI00189580DE|nr:HNH endonuclease [Nocardia cyriacigeorgica]